MRPIWQWGETVYDERVAALRDVEREAQRILAHPHLYLPPDIFGLESMPHPMLTVPSVCSASHDSARAGSRVRVTSKEQSLIAATTGSPLASACQWPAIL